jgi:Tfp pilus assembly protein PilV
VRSVRAILKILMLRRWVQRSERGDTLIEVTFALAILGFVLLGSTAIAAAAFRTGQTARERTQVVQVAQDQMEALRTFRDNHTWAEFRQGVSPAFQGVDNAPATACTFNAARTCFHMNLTTGVPVTGAMTSTSPGTNLTVPTAIIEITTVTPGSQRACAYDFELHYSFTPLGGGTKAVNHITTRLSNLKYDPGAGAPACP